MAVTSMMMTILSITTSLQWKADDGAYITMTTDNTSLSAVTVDTLD